MNSSYIQIFENEEIKSIVLRNMQEREREKKKCSKANIQDM